MRREGKKERRRKKERRENEQRRRKQGLCSEGDRRRARVRLLFVGKGGPLTAVSLISVRWGPPIGHMKAKKSKVVVDLVLHRPLN